jgi:hypothetical protein
MAIKPSKETQTQATKISKGIQKPGQTIKYGKIIQLHGVTIITFI